MMIKVELMLPERHLPGVILVNGRVVTFQNGEIIKADLKDREIKAAEDFLKSAEMEKEAKRLKDMMEGTVEGSTNSE